jgi:ketosteroid isomerase-like protein
MSEENVEIVRRVTTEFTETHQVSELLVAPDLVFDVSSWLAWSGEQEFHGPDGFMAFFAEWTGAYEEWDQQVDGIIDAGGNQVVETTRQRGRLPGSDSWVEWRYGIVYTVEEGLITRGKLYATAEEALEAAGLSE